MSKIVVVGAGKTGRGFIARLLQEASEEVIFIDKNVELVEALNKEKEFKVSFFGNVREAYNVHNFKACTWETADLEDAELILVSVGGQNLKDVGASLAPLLSNEKHYYIITAENASHPSKTLREAIGNLKSLTFGEIDSEDVYHFARKYPDYMEDWICDLKEGESAFNNIEERKPYKIVKGKRETLKSGHLGNKFRRLFWDKSCACVATRNDLLASQDTIHPSDNRVLSIRELMRVMTISENFKWTYEDIHKLENKEAFLKKHELNIRRCIGEAVPTKIMNSIAKNINIMLEFENFVAEYKKKNLEKYLSNKEIYDNNFYIQAFLYEELLSDRKKTGSFYTPQSVVFNSVKYYENDKKTIRKE